jgi:hypothetical protein
MTMARNPFLKVHVVCGYYDMATVFMGSEINMYTRPSAHKALKDDVAKFIAGSSGPKSKSGTQQ